MKQILTLSLFCLGILIIIVSLYLLTKTSIREPFLNGFVELNYTPPENSLTDQEKTYVNVNILKQAVEGINDQLDKMSSDILNLQDQVTTLTNQQSDLVSSNTPTVDGTDM